MANSTVHQTMKNTAKAENQVMQGRQGSVPSRPSLSCRTSPPQGGRLDGRSAFANLQRCRAGADVDAANLPPCGGDVRQDREGQRRARTLPALRPFPSRLLQFDQRAEKILGVQEQHRLAVRADFWIAVAEYA